MSRANSQASKPAPKSKGYLDHARESMVSEAPKYHVGSSQSRIQMGFEDPDEGFSPLKQEGSRQNFSYEKPTNSLLINGNYGGLSLKELDQQMANASGYELVAERAEKGEGGPRFEGE
uniref:Uncharacterized protein n=1 Tax=Strombidium rassoulzadegani TaxID=1082188 RepID=A0A7S3FVM3_9SPIT|mmetsp:Transcript_11955/g.20193  ORF Transcript_11955/g.20193 Transcript_11955/m.20193 type:complete len:118 (+) Transcript_11955:2081-2434(+)